MTTNLTTPFINTISAFETLIGTTIPLNVLGGTSITDYQFYISNLNNSILYTSPKFSTPNDIATEDIRSFNMVIDQAVITASQMKNNNSYYITAKTFNGANESQFAVQKVFNCYKAPSFIIKYYPDLLNPVILDSSRVINSDKIYALLEFQKNDNNSVAILDRANINLYGVRSNGQEDIVFSGTAIYNEPLQQTITGLTRTNLPDSIYANYKLVASGTTTDGFVFQSEASGFTCEYVQIANSAKLRVSNVCDKGYIKIESELSDMEGTASPNPPIYLTPNGIDLTAENSNVLWQGYFNLNEQYTNRWWGSDFTNNATIIKLLTQILTSYAEVKYINNGTNSYVALTVYGQNQFPYYIESNKIASNLITATTPLFIGIQYSFGLWELGFDLM